MGERNYKTSDTSVIYSTISIKQSSTMSVCPSVCLKLKISVTTKPIGLYSSGNIPTGPGMVLSYFLWGWDTPTPQNIKNAPPPKISLL